MAEEIAFENGWISNYEGLMTLTLDRVILHTVMHHSSTSTYMPNFTKIKETLWTDGRTYACTRTYVDGRTYVHMDGQTFETHFMTKKIKDKPYVAVPEVDRIRDVVGGMLQQL